MPITRTPLLVTLPLMTIEKSVYRYRPSETVEIHRMACSHGFAINPPLIRSDGHRYATPQMMAPEGWYPVLQTEDLCIRLDSTLELTINVELINHSARPPHELYIGGEIIHAPSRGDRDRKRAPKKGK